MRRYAARSSDQGRAASRSRSRRSRASAPVVASGERFADIVARDLDLSGFFRVIPRDAYIEDARLGGHRRHYRLPGLGDDRRAAAGERDGRALGGRSRGRGAAFRRRRPDAAHRYALPQRRRRHPPHRASLRRRDHARHHRGAWSIRLQDHVRVAPRGSLQGDLRDVSRRRRPARGHARALDRALADAGARPHGRCSSRRTAAATRVSTGSISMAPIAVASPTGEDSTSAGAGHRRVVRSR